MPFLDSLISFAETHAWMAAPGLYILFVLTTLLCLPASGLTLACGAVLGIGPGTLTASLGTLTSTTLSRLVARGRWGSRVRNWITQHPRLRIILQAVNDGGWRLVALIRISPTMPIGAMNWVFAFTEVPLPRYLFITALGTLPAKLMWVSVGATGRQSLEIWVHPEQADPAQWVLLGLAAVGTVGSVTFIGILTGRRLRKELSKTRPSEPR